MRRFLLYVVLFLCVSKTYSGNYHHFRDSTKFRHELGCNLITIKITSHINNTNIPEPFAQYLNGFFYKISKKDAGLRIIANYSHRRYSAYYETFYLMNGYHTFNKCRYVLLSVGFQNKILSSRAFRNLYAFGDVYHNYILLEGTELKTSSQPIGSFHITANKIGLNAGIGYRIRLTKSVFLLPEIYYDLHSTYANLNYQSLNPPETSAFHSARNSLKPFLRVNFTIRL